MPPLFLVACGFAAPLIATILYMVLSGALPYYVDIVRGYYPLYAQVTQNLTIISAPDKRLIYLITTYTRFGRYAGWFTPAVATFTIASSSGALAVRNKRRIALVGWLAVAYSVYPVFSGQFFGYHWLPFAFFIIVLAAMCLATQPSTTNHLLNWAPLVAVILGVASQTTVLANNMDQVQTYLVKGNVPSDDTADRAEDMAARLAERIQPGDTVQPLDWIDGGVLHALLLERARIATPYIADMVFYQDITSPYVINLRNDFLRRLDASSPRFVLDFQYVTWIRGPHSTDDFPELRLWLADRYAPVAVGNTYELDERVRAADSGGRRSIVLITSEPLALTQWDAIFPNLPITMIDAVQLVRDEKLVAMLSGATQGADEVTLIFMNSPTDLAQRVQAWAAQNLACRPERNAAGARLVDCSTKTRRDTTFPFLGLSYSNSPLSRILESLQNPH